MKVEIKDMHDSHGLVFTLEMTTETELDKEVANFFRQTVKNMPRHQHGNRLFLYAYKVSVGKFISIFFSEQVEHTAVLDNGRDAKVIEVEV